MASVARVQYQHHALCRRVEATPRRIRAAPLPGYTRVYKRSGAARGLSSSSRQSWYCAPAYTYVTRDLRQYTMSELYSTAALKTGRIETQLPPLNAHRSRRSRRERQGSISRVQTFSEIFDPRSRTHGANKILNNM